MKAIELGSKIRNLIIDSDTGTVFVAEWFDIVNLMRMKTFPL